MRTLLFPLLLLFLTACTTLDKVRSKDLPQEEKELPELAESEEGLYPEAADTSPAATPSPATVPPGAGVIVPRSQRQATPPDQGARPQVPGTGADSRARTENAPTPYGASPPAPAPYGQVARSPAATSGATTPGRTYEETTVRPNTTMTATPKHYEHVTSVAPANVNPSLANALTGLWVNTLDPDEVVEFTPSQYTTFYEGKRIIQEPMSVHGRCPGDCTGGSATDQACLTIAGPAGIDCFGIVRLSATELELKILGVSDETITYRRQ